MRFSTSAVLSLPLLSAAAESPFETYKAKFSSFLSNFGVLPPQEQPAEATAESASSVKTDAKTIETLTLENWRDTLYSPVKAGATTPEQWWVLISGRNQTCHGRCGKIETTFNETAAEFALLPKSPHLAYLNCDDQPVLCNAWATHTGNLWHFEMLPPPNPTAVYWRRLNLTTTTSGMLVDLYAKESKEEAFRRYEGYFHPFDGPLAKYGLLIPTAYFFWALSFVPSWAVVLGISFISKTVMYVSDKSRARA